MSNYVIALDTVCKSHNLLHTTPHMFRHTHETILWESNISYINYIGARLGDTDKSILLNTYGHMSRRSELLNNEKVNSFMSDCLKQIK